MKLEILSKDKIYLEIILVYTILIYVRKWKKNQLNIIRTQRVNNNFKRMCTFIGVYKLESLKTAFEHIDLWFSHDWTC